MVKHGWFVCPTVSMVTTSHATGLEKTLLGGIAYREGAQGSAFDFSWRSGDQDTSPYLHPKNRSLL